LLLRILSVSCCNACGFRRILTEIRRKHHLFNGVGEVDPSIFDAIIFDTLVVAINMVVITTDVTIRGSNLGAGFFTSGGFSTLGTCITAMKERIYALRRPPALGRFHSPLPLL
jgi:hypothetical protein